MKQIFAFFAIYAVVVGTSSCSDGNPSLPLSPGNAVTFHQIERLARPAVKEATQGFALHDNTNRTAPWAQPLSSQSLYQSVGSFVTTVAGRRADYATTIQAILIPDEIAVDLSQNATKAAYLGVETGGATGSKYGGRALTDDVIDADLGVIFGKTLSALGLLSDDGKSSPCLTTDNVNYNPVTKRVTAVFPYAGTPN